MRSDSTDVSDAPSVLVTDGSLSIGVSVVRSLGRAGWRVVTVDSAPPPRVFRSRYVDRSHRTPSPELDPVGFAAAVADIAEREQVDLVFPTTDKTILALSERRETFPAPLALPDHEALTTAADKHRTTALAAQLGIPVPRSVMVEDLPAFECAAERLGWPLLIKPLRSHSADETGAVRTRSVTVAHDMEQARGALASDGIGGLPVQLQAHVAGTGVGIELLVLDGTTVAAFQHRRLREVPLDGGMSSLREAEPVDPELLDHSERLLGALGWHGLAMVEFRVGPVGPVLLEVNGRTWGSIALPIRAGVDFPRLLAASYVDAASPSPVRPAPGTQSRSLRLELHWLAAAVLERRSAHPRTDVSLKRISSVLLGLANPRNNFDLQTLDDPGPGIHDAAGSVVEVAAAARKRVRRPA